MYDKLIEALINLTIFTGTLITIICLIVFMFITSSSTLAILAGVGAANALFVYDRYRQKNIK